MKVEKNIVWKDECTKSSLKILGKRKNKFRKRKEEENFEIRVIELDNI